MADDEFNLLLDSPVEFMAAAAEAEECLAQSIQPANGRYVGHCNCGGWDVETDTMQEGLRLARAHTDATAGRQG